MTMPSVETVATEGVALDQVTGNPVTTLPAVSRAVAIACVVCPLARLDAARATATVAIRPGVAFTVVSAVLPSAEAVTSAEPTWCAVTAPTEETLTMDVSELLQTMGRS
jgi:hypothetical protein